MRYKNVQITLYTSIGATFVFITSDLRFVQYGGSNQNLCHRVRVTVGGWTTILEVPTSVFLYLPRYPDARVPVGDAGGELAGAGRLELSGEPPDVILALMWVVQLQVFLVTLRELVNSCPYSSGNDIVKLMNKWINA